MRFKKSLVAAAVVAVVALGATAAYAWFSAPGSGTGTATVGTASNIELTGGALSGALYPGGSAQTFTISIHNPGAGAQQVGTVTLTSVSATGGCVATVPTVFSMTPVVVNASVPAGGTITRTGSISMADTGVDQNSCQGSTLTLNLASS